MIGCIFLCLDNFKREDLAQAILFLVVEHAVQLGQSMCSRYNQDKSVIIVALLQTQL